MSRAFVDTNIVVYAIHDPDGHKQESARRVMQQHQANRSLVLSTQVLQETYSVLTVKKGLPGDAAMLVLESLAEEEVVSSSPSLVLAAAGVAFRYRISIWDALMVQAALDAQCAVLYTEDLQAGMRFGSLEVVNPFMLSAHEPAAPSLVKVKSKAKATAEPRRVATSAAATSAVMPAPRRPRR